MSDTEKIKERAKAQLQELSDVDKRLLKLYIQLSAEDLLAKALQFSDRLQTTPYNEKRKEYQKQFELYQIAYILKNQGIQVKGGRRKTLRRKRRNTSFSRRVGWQQRKSLKRN